MFSLQPSVTGRNSTVLQAEEEKVGTVLGTRQSEQSREGPSLAAQVETARESVEGDVSGVELCEHAGLQASGNLGCCTSGQRRLAVLQVRVLIRVSSETKALRVVKG
jgi:hypothetical protein